MLWFLKICTFNILLYWPNFVFPLFSFSCLFYICPIHPFSPSHYTPCLMEQSFTSTLNSIFQTQLQKLLTCQPYLKVSSNDKGTQPSLQLLLILLIPGWKLICPGNASCAWLRLRLFTWVFPGVLWHVCLLAFSSLQVETNSVSLRMLPAWLHSSVL